MNPLEIKTAIGIQKSVSEVFAAIVDPAKMSGYFISKSNGRMETGAELIWYFPEFKDAVPVRVGKVEKDKFISFYWNGEDEKETFTQINLSEGKNGSTIVRISEGTKENDVAGLQWLQGNTEGWTNFLNCLKAYLEYGINLRKGAYDFRGDASLSIG